jgi:hypothetical protein
MMKAFAYLLLAGLSLASLPGQAQPAPGGQRTGQGGGARRGPPPEALAACQSLAAGAACSFTSSRGAHSGSCFAPEGKALACRPARGGAGEGPGQGQGRPQ